ncbi:MAG: SdrD B-like domain-containing protein [Cyanobacteria bacterium P01_F01_bin.42]
MTNNPYSPRFTNLPRNGKLSISENTTFVIDVESTDNRGSEQNGQLSYSIVGGVDSEFFTLDERTGVLEFINPPDFENGQSNYNTGDNIYDVKIQVEDAAHFRTHKTLWVMVTDEVESMDAFCIDFEADGNGSALHRGQIIDNEFEALGISVFGVRPGEALDGSAPNRAMIFDSANPTGGDRDLATDNQDNILIISEDLDSNDPDDNAHGGTFVFEFDSPRSLSSLGFVDIEESGGEIRAFDASGNLISDADVPIVGDGGQGQLDFDVDGVSRLEIELSGSGAVGKIGFDSAGVGDFVFVDANGDGIQDPTELGAEGVTVTLIGGGADGVIGTGGDDTTATVTTDQNGFYEFLDLNVGEEYQLAFELPDGFEFTDLNVGDDALDSDANPASGRTDVFTLNPGEFNSTFDAGLDPVEPGTIGDKVFNDLNRDGIQGDNEPGVEGVSVTITGAGEDGQFGTADDTQVTTTTDANGNYGSGPLDPGAYQVTFDNLPDGFEFTTQDAGNDDALDSDANPSNGTTGTINLGEGENRDDVDAGIVAKLARLGNEVFDDRNGNGIKDRGEQGVRGVTVTLLGGGADGLLSTTEDNTEDSRITDQRGRYSFGDLTPGTEYQVRFSDLPTGFEFTQANQGSNDALDSDADPTTGTTDTIVLAPGEFNPTIDAGLVFTLNPDEKFVIRGTKGPDRLQGTRVDDDIRGLGETDLINGFEGNDHLLGNGGFDTINGGSGRDTIDGGLQDDILRGESGNDLIIGGEGNDLLVGGGGRDTLDGTNGAGTNEQDTLRGNGGPDLFVLGNELSAYYVGDGDNGFATIQDFNAASDTIQLNGSVGDYTTQENGTDIELIQGGDLVAVFTNIDSLDINQSATFV